MPDTPVPPPPAAIQPPLPTQSVVVQPAQPSPAGLTANVAILGEWAGAIIAIAALVTLLYKALTRELSRDVAEVRREVGDVDHRARGALSRVDALEHLRTGDLERIVRVEVAVTAFEKGLDRIDRTINERFDTLAQSVREIRVVAPREQR